MSLSLPFLGHGGPSFFALAPVPVINFSLFSLSLSVGMAKRERQRESGEWKEEHHEPGWWGTPSDCYSHQRK